MKKSKRHQTNLISAIIIIITIALIVLLSICLYKQASLEVRFDAIINWLAKIEKAIAGLDTHVEILLCLFALYIAKCHLPIPMSVLCVISGMVFDINAALIINIIFCLFFFVVKHTEGKLMGGGWAMMILNIRQAKFIKNWVLFKGSGNPYVLAVSRFVPTIPLGMVSKLYGSMNYDFVYYCCLSLLGFMPRLYIYTKIGTALYNPFSREFIILLIIIVAFTGLTTLIFNIFYGIKSRQMTKTLLMYSQKEKYKIVL
ncbi:MAG: hypothetical protein LIO43_00325 [Clostridiales bacterium]|nr:hypothetical protein [Clostridiales bacterium]